MDTAYNLLIEKLSKQAGDMRIPINGAFELTSRCNLNCRMCYIHSEKQDPAIIKNELTTEQWLRLASEARDAGMLNLILTGGEIFVRDDFEVIYENVARMGFRITLYTNGTLLDAKKVKMLRRLPPSTIEITIYGASADTYEKLCGNGAAYEKVVQAIDLLLAEGISPELKTTVTNINLKDYDTMAEFSFKRHLPFSIVDYLYPASCSCNEENAFRLTPEELIDYKEAVFKTNRRLAEIYFKDVPEPQASDCASRLIQELRDMPSDRQRDKNTFYCNAGSSDFWITWNGRMLPCGAMEEPVFSPLEIGFKKAWKELNEQCESIPSCPECGSCDLRKYCMVCPAKLKTETGYYDRPAPYMCNLARLYKERLSTIQDFR